MMSFTALSPRENEGKFRPLDDCTMFIVDYDPSLSLDWNHWSIASLLATQMNWMGEVSGGRKDYPGRTRRFIFTGE